MGDGVSDAGYERFPFHGRKLRPGEDGAVGPQAVTGIVHDAGGKPVMFIKAFDQWDGPEVAEALTAHLRASVPDAIPADVIARAAEEHDCPSGAKGEAPEPIVVWAFQSEALVPVWDDGEPWEHEGDHYSYERPEPVTMLAFPCGLLAPLDNLYATPGKRPADALNARAQADADREELALLRDFHGTFCDHVTALALGDSPGDGFVDAARACRNFYAAHPERLEGRA